MATFLQYKHNKQKQKKNNKQKINASYERNLSHNFVLSNENQTISLS